MESVNYPGLEGHPLQQRVQKHYPRGAGGFLTFDLNGGFEAGKAFLNNVELASRLVNLGDAKTSVTHPASTTHSQLTEEQLLAAGVGPGQIRVATGLEHIDDLIQDFQQALDATQKLAAA